MNMGYCSYGIYIPEIITYKHGFSIEMKRPIPRVQITEKISITFRLGLLRSTSLQYKIKSVFCVRWLDGIVKVIQVGSG